MKFNLYLQAIKSQILTLVMLLFVVGINPLFAQNEEEEELNWTTFSNRQKANNHEGEERINTDYVLVTYDKETIKFIYPDRDDLVIQFPITSKFDGIDDMILYTSEMGIANIRVDNDRNVTVYYEDKTIIQFETDLYFYWSDQSELEPATVEIEEEIER